MFCKNCGKKIKENSKFCNQCGADVNASIDSQNIVTPKINKVSKPKNNKNVIIIVVIVVIFLAVIGGILLIGGFIFGDNTSGSVDYTTSLGDVKTLKFDKLSVDIPSNFEEDDNPLIGNISADAPDSSYSVFLTEGSSLISPMFSIDDKYIEGQLKK